MHSGSGACSFGSDPCATLAEPSPSPCTRLASADEVYGGPCCPVSAARALGHDPGRARTPPPLPPAPPRAPPCPPVCVLQECVLGCAAGALRPA